MSQRTETRSARRSTAERPGSVSASVEGVRKRVRRMAEMAAELEQRTRSVMEETEGLLAECEEVRRELDTIARRVDARRSRRPTERPAGRLRPHDEARMAATRMALEGTDRDEISDRLRDDFEVEDPGRMLSELGL